MRRRNTGLTDRNLFNKDHGPGKGDVPRSGWSAEYKQNFDEINFWPEAAGFRREGNKLIKVYK